MNYKRYIVIAFLVVCGFIINPQTLFGVALDGDCTDDSSCDSGLECHELLGICVVDPESSSSGGSAGGSGGSSSGGTPVGGGTGSTGNYSAGGGTPIDQEAMRQSIIKQYGGSCTPPGCVSLENPVLPNTILELFGGAIKIAMGILGSLALLVVVYGGFMWLTAAGNPEQVKKGTTAITWAVIGIVVIFSSYAIINLVLKGLGATEDRSVPYQWCLTPENKCVIGVGGGCSAGQLFSTEFDCLQNVKQCFCKDKQGNFLPQVSTRSKAECEVSTVEFGMEGVECKWDTKGNAEQSR